MIEYPFVLAITLDIPCQSWYEDMIDCTICKLINIWSSFFVLRDDENEQEQEVKEAVR